MIYILFQYNPNPPNSVMRLCSSLSSFCTHIFQETNRVCEFSSLTIQTATLHLPGRTHCALSFRVSTGQERIPKEESAQNVDPGEEISLAAAPAGTRTCDFPITSPELYHWVTTSPPPITPTSDSGQISIAPRRNRTCIYQRCTGIDAQTTELHSHPSKINQKGRN